MNLIAKPSVADAIVMFAMDEMVNSLAFLTPGLTAKPMLERQWDVQNVLGHYTKPRKQIKSLLKAKVMDALGNVRAEKVKLEGPFLEYRNINQRQVR